MSHRSASKICRRRPRSALTDRFDLARPPSLGEERFERAVETQNREPTFFWIGLNPVAAFDARGLGRAEVDRRGAVGARFGGRRREALAARAWITLRRVKH